MRVRIIKRLKRRETNIKRLKDPHIQNVLINFALSVTDLTNLMLSL